MIGRIDRSRKLGCRMCFKRYKDEEGRDLFERFKKSSRWETIEITGNNYDVYTAIFRDINNGKFVFIDVNKSNSGKTEYWSFSEKPRGLFLLKLFKSSSEWEELDMSLQLGKNDHDFSNSSSWIFQNLDGTKVCISNKSANRNGKFTSWYYDGNLADIPSYDCLILNRQKPSKNSS